MPPVPPPQTRPDSPSMPSPLPDLTLPPKPHELDLPTALCKGIQSAHNPSANYVALSYHRLSPLHYTCLSSLSSTFIPKSPSEGLSHPEWRQVIIDEMRALQSSGYGNQFLYLTGSFWLVFLGFILSRLGPMVRLCWWPKDTLRYLDWIIVTVSHPWQNDIC